MQTFIFIYRNPTRYAPTPETSAAMKAWFDEMGERLAELGKPVVASDTVGNCSPGTTELNGYSIVQAEDLAEALAIAKECPHLTRNGGIEVGELGEVPGPSRLTA
jgi:YCII-related domain